MFRINQYHYGKRTLKLGIFLGGLQFQMGAVSSYMGYINTAISASTLYIVSSVAKLSFIQYILLLVLVVAIVMLVDWVFIQPGRQIYANQQGWEHNNPVKQYLDEKMVTKEYFDNAIKSLRGKDEYKTNAT